MAKKLLKRKSPGPLGPIRFRAEVKSSKKPVLNDNSKYFFTELSPGVWDIWSHSTSKFSIRDSLDNNSITDITIQFSESFTLKYQAYTARYNLSGLVNYTINEGVKFNYNTSFKYAFLNCFSLKNVNIPDSAFDTNPNTSINNMERAFMGCTSLESIDMSGWFCTYALDQVNEMFKGCTNLTNVTMFNPVVNGLTRSYNMFEGCTSLIDLVIPWGRNRIFWAADMFRDCVNLTNLDISNWIVYNDGLTGVNSQGNFSYMFKGCKNLLDTNRFFAPDTNSGKTGGFSDLYRINNMFEGCKSLINVDISHLAFYKCVKAGQLFKECSNLESVQFYTMLHYPPVGDINDMFQCCASLVCVNNMNTTASSDHSNVFRLTDWFGCDVSGSSLVQPTSSKITELQSPAGKSWTNPTACP